MKKIFVPILFLVLQVTLLAQTEDNRYAIFLLGIEVSGDTTLKNEVIPDMFEIVKKEIIDTDSLGERQVSSFSDISSAIKNYDQEATICPDTECVEAVVKEQKIRRLILIELSEAKISGTERDLLRVSGTINMSLINVEQVSGTDMVILLTDNTSEPIIRGNYPQLISTIRINIWKLFGLEPPADRFSEKDLLSAQATLLQKLSPYFSDRRIVLGVGVAVSLLIGGIIYFMISSNDVSHTYPPDFPEIP